jgi:hypothetical protein
VVKQSRVTDNPTIDSGYPGRHPIRRSEIVVETTTGIIPADRRVFVDPPMVFGQLDPQFRQLE